MKTLLLTGAALAALVPSVAMAQQAAPAATAPAATVPTAAPDAPASPPQQESSTTLGEITVTALRRETNLQTTPVSITVMGRQALQDRHVQSLLDLQDGAVPSLRVATFEARRTALTIGIRGIVPLDANQPAREQGVGIYVDGVYLGRQHGLDAALLDLDRIEVLRGPQGTLFGRNTEGGALSLVTRRPTGEFGLRTVTGFGNYGAYNGEFHLNLPRMGDFSIKIDGLIQNRDATVENPLPGSRGFNSFYRRGLRGTLRWQPSDSFTADLDVDNTYEESTAFYSQLENFNPLGLPVGPATGTLPAGQIRPLAPLVQVRADRMDTADIGVPQQPDIGHQSGSSLHLTWRPVDGLELRSITAFRTLDQTQYDNSGGAHRPPVFTPNGAFSRYSLADLFQRQASQEFQAVGSISRIDYVAGLFYFFEKARDDAATPNSNQWNADGTGFTIRDLTPTLPGFRSLDRASIAHSRSYAAYGQFTWTPPILDDRLHLTLGGRYTSDDKDGTLFVINNAPRNLTYAQNTSRFNPMVTLAFEPMPGIDLYAKYATGYRSGGASSRSGTYRSFGPEDVTSYEVGAKFDFWDNRARLNFAAYAMDRENSQIDFNAIVFDPVLNTNRNTLETINAPGTTRIRGIEIDGSIRPIENLTISGGYAYTSTEVPNTVNPFTGIAQPVFIVFTPRNAASIAVDYSIPRDFGTVRFHVDANYADGQHSFDQQALLTDDSFIVNGRVSLANIPIRATGGTFTVSAWARNLFDEEHVYRRSLENRTTLGDYANFNEPRTYGLELSTSF